MYFSSKVSLNFVLICYHLQIYWMGLIQHVESSLRAKFQLDLLSNSGIIANNMAKYMFSFSLNFTVRELYFSFSNSYF